ncbi:hypothetical protein ACOMHN_012888 [Nucella lapillus]
MAQGYVNDNRGALFIKNLGRLYPQVFSEIFYQWFQEQQQRQVAADLQIPPRSRRRPHDGPQRIPQPARLPPLSAITPRQRRLEIKWSLVLDLYFAAETQLSRFWESRYYHLLARSDLQDELQIMIGELETGWECLFLAARALIDLSERLEAEDEEDKRHFRLIVYCHRLMAHLRQEIGYHLWYLLDVRDNDIGR